MRCSDAGELTKLIWKARLVGRRSGWNRGATVWGGRNICREACGEWGDLGSVGVQGARRITRHEL